MLAAPKSTLLRILSGRCFKSDLIRSQLRPTSRSPRR
jgi:hypothetical protein